MEGPSDPTAPLVSVVVPMFDVAAYVEECLESILIQPGVRLDVVVVDDASTDDGARVAEGVAAMDDRVRVVRQPRNRGLGAARNIGLGHARGELVTFADADDVVQHGAYRAMVRCLRGSGSDFVVGSMARHPEIGADQPDNVPAWLVPLHRREERRTTIDASPALLRNVFAWTKMFRRSFWDTAGLAFPEGVSYEDHELSARAYLAADTFDVLPDVVYRWRLRTAGSSITQRKHEESNLRDFALARAATHDLLTSRAGPRVLAEWHSLLLDDLWPYLEHVRSADPGYHDVLRRTAQWSLAQLGPEDLARAGVRVRVLTTLVAQGRRDEAVAALDHLAARPLDRRPAVVAVDSFDELALEGLPEPLPPGLLRLAGVDRRLVVTLRRAILEGDRLELAGVVQLIGVADRGETPRASLVLEELRGPGRRVLPLRADRRPESGGSARRPAGAWPLVDVWGEVRLSSTTDSMPWTVEVEVEVGTGTVAGVFSVLGTCGLPRTTEDGVEPVTWSPGPGLRLARGPA